MPAHMTLYRVMRLLRICIIDRVLLLRRVTRVPYSVHG